VTLLALFACNPPIPEDTGASAADDTGAPVDDTGTTADPTFQNTTWPIYTSTCSPCHDTWGDASDPASVYDHLTTYLHGDNPLVVAGNPDTSLFYGKLLDPPMSGDRMPLQLSLLEDWEIDALGAWIDAGATREGFDDGFWTTWQHHRCAECHEDLGGAYEEAVYDSLTTMSYAQWDLVAPGSRNDSLLYLKVATDSPPVGARMPLTFDYLDGDRIARVRAWIEQGAPYE
jgi:hypothetical protein